MSLSVVIPTYGRDEVLVETVQRVLAQDPPAAELVVADQTPRHGPGAERELARLAADGAIEWLRLETPSIPRAMNAGLLRARSEVVLYLETPPDAGELKALLRKLGVRPRDLLRRGEEEYRTSGLSDKSTDAEIIAAMARYPKLIERPVAVCGDEAVIGRPPERVLELLD